MDLDYLDLGQFITRKSVRFAAAGRGFECGSILNQSSRIGTTSTGSFDLRMMPAE